MCSKIKLTDARILTICQIHISISLCGVCISLISDTSEANKSNNYNILYGCEVTNEKPVYLSSFHLFMSRKHLKEINLCLHISVMKEIVVRFLK